MSLENDYMKAYSLNISEKKLSQVQSILERKIGEGWKKTLFFVLVVIVLTISLIIFGINTTDSPYKKSISHVKVFFIILLISISFFIVWVVIKPNIYNKQTGIVPFPPGDTLVPVDQTQCGILPLECTTEGQNVCEEKCTDKGNTQSNYSCRLVKHPNTYYLGTKLEVGKKYCLPQIAQYDSVSDCGTYTGRIVWSQNPDGTLGWRCQCLYPDLFSGDTCTTQIACKKTYDDSNPALLKDKDGNIWTSSSPPPSGTTPYDSYETTENGKTIIKPRFKCACSERDPGFYSIDSDPFSCNQDVCYVGTNLSDSARLDINTMQCKCDNQRTYKSNISGFCYPIQETDKGCNLNMFGNGCMYGIDLFPPGDTAKRIIFKKGNNYYISDTIPKNTFIFNTPPPPSNTPSIDLSGKYSILVDVTDVVENKDNSIDKTKIISIDNTILKDAFYSFPIRSKADYSNISNIVSDIKDLLNEKDKVKIRLENIAKMANKGRDNGISYGIPKLCNSYFYRRDGLENCKNPLSKTGTEPIFTKDLDTSRICGSLSSKAVINIDNYPYGYNCDCGESGKKQKPDLKDKNGEPPQICYDCIKSGYEGESNAQKCCIIDKDDNGNIIANIQKGRVNGGRNMIKPDKLCKDDKCCKGPNERCEEDSECASGACAFRNKDEFGSYWQGGGKRYCCPRGSQAVMWSYSWCNHGEAGDPCNHDGQCMSDKCTNAKCE